MKRFSRHMVEAILNWALQGSKQDYTPIGAGLSKSNFALMG